MSPFMPSGHETDWDYSRALDYSTALGARTGQDWTVKDK